jgi:hypothetical protein
MKVRLLQAAFALCALIVSIAASAAQQTFVASNGSDANPCTLALPCSSLGAAVTQTSSGGEVIVLDSGSYGPVTITASVSIIAPSGVHAGVVVFSGDGIAVNAPGAIVTLRGLTISGQGGTNGINATSVGQLRVEGVHVSGFASYKAYGLLFAAANGSLTAIHSVFEGNWIGIESEPSRGSTVSIVVDDTALTHNAAGYRSIGPGTTNATITRTNVSANSENGLLPIGSSTDTLALEGCVVSNNGFIGIETLGKVVLSNNTITGNEIGVYSMGGAIETRGNNTVRQNGTNVVGSLTAVSGI